MVDDFLKAHPGESKAVTVRLGKLFTVRSFRALESDLIYTYGKENLVHLFRSDRAAAVDKAFAKNRKELIVQEPLYRTLERVLEEERSMQKNSSKSLSLNNRPPSVAPKWPATTPGPLKRWLCPICSADPTSWTSRTRSRSSTVDKKFFDILIPWRTSFEHQLALALARARRQMRKSACRAPEVAGVIETLKNIKKGVSEANPAIVKALNLPDNNALAGLIGKARLDEILATK
jgi:hypothetical protein